MQRKKITDLEELLLIMREDLLTPALTSNMKKTHKSFVEKSNERYKQFEQWVSDRVDAGEERVYLQFRQSEFPRDEEIALLQKQDRMGAKYATGKMDGRFPLAGKQEGVSYTYTDGGHLLSKVRRVAEFQIMPEPSLKSLRSMLKESIGTLYSVFELEKLLGRVERGAKFTVDLRTLSGEVYDISDIVSEIIKELRQESQAKLQAREQPSDSEANKAQPEKQKVKRAGIPRSGAMDEAKLREQHEGQQLSRDLKALNEKREQLEKAIKDPKSKRMSFMVDQEMMRSINELAKLKKQIKDVEEKLVSLTVRQKKSSGM